MKASISIILIEVRQIAQNSANSAKIGKIKLRSKVLTHNVWREESPIKNRKKVGLRPKKAKSLVAKFLAKSKTPHQYQRNKIFHRQRKCFTIVISHTEETKKCSLSSQK